jgi:hypothetical protein
VGARIDTRPVLDDEASGYDRGGVGARRREGREGHEREQETAAEHDLEDLRRRRMGRCVPYRSCKLTGKQNPFDAALPAAAGTSS